MAALQGGYEHIPKHVIGGALAATHMRGRYRYPGRRCSYTHISHHTGCTVVWSGYTVLRNARDQSACPQLCWPPLPTPSRVPGCGGRRARSALIRRGPNASSAPPHSVQAACGCRTLPTDTVGAVEEFGMRWRLKEADPETRGYITLVGGLASADRPDHRVRSAVLCPVG